MKISEGAAKKIQIADGQAGHQRWRSSCRCEGRRLLGVELYVRLGEGARTGDEVFEGNGAKIFVDKKSYLFLKGTTLDYDTALLTQGFVFHNPNAKQTCGCGSSFGA